MEYTWKITGLKTASNGTTSDAVVQTHWQKIGTDENGNIGTFSGATPFEISKVSPENFVEFKDLTEEMVLNWIKSIVVDGYEEHVNKQIQKDIDDKTIVVKDTPMPWAPVKTEEE